jgi:hypothetical protein
LKAGTFSLRIEEVKEAKERFIKPKDKFWPLKAYEKLFGKPTLKCNKSKGHKVVTAHGHKGVVVPNEDAEEGPWDVETSYATATEMRKTLYDKPCDESSDFSDEADQIFDDLVEDQDAAYEECAVGQSFQDLLQSVSEEASATSSAKDIVEQSRQRIKSKKKADTTKIIKQVTLSQRDPNKMIWTWGNLGNIQAAERPAQHAGGGTGVGESQEPILQRK